MDFNLEPGLTLEEAMHLLHDDLPYDMEPSEVFIEPPAPCVDTDEDSGDDEGGLVDNLNSRQLQSGAQIMVNHVFSGEQYVYPASEYLEEQSISADDVPTSQDDVQSAANDVSTSQDDVQSAANYLKIPKPVKKMKWLKNGDLVECTNTKTKLPNFDQFSNKTCVEVLELFLSNEIIDFLVDQIRKYASFKNCADPTITADEVRCFIGILIITGYDNKPGKQYYWDTGEDIKNILISEAMRRDRFYTIMKFMHCADNTQLVANDKAWKLRPLMNKLKMNFVDHCPDVSDLSYDESMVKYYGRHSCKQFIRGKPIRFGYKMWSLNTSFGYLINFDLYQGQIPNGRIEVERFCGKAAAPLIYMLEELPRGRSYNIFIDNLFTGFNLLKMLKQNGHRVTGTIRENRIPKNASLVKKDDMKKKMKRGDYSSRLEKNNGIQLIRWLDNSVVTMASTVYGLEPTKQAKRYSRADKKIITVKQPYAISKYNECMGGTDLMDKNINRHRISVRSKKWWWPIFTWLIDASIQNAWILKKGKGNMTQLHFRREVATEYLKRFKSVKKRTGFKRKSASLQTRVLDQIRLDGLNHLVCQTPSGNRLRCAGHECKSQIRTMCSNCKVGLCIPCFANFHGQ